MDVKSHALGLVKLIVIALYDIKKQDRYNRETPLRALVLHPNTWCDLQLEGKIDDFWVSNDDAVAGIRRWRGMRVEFTLTEDAHFITRSGRKVYL